MIRSRVGTFVRSLSVVAEASIASTVPKSRQHGARFALFPTPTVVTPPFELSRSLGNLISKLTYLGFELGYTDAKFASGAESAIALAAKCIKQNDSAAMSAIMLSPCVSKLRQRLDEIPPELVQKRFDFTRDNIIYSGYHSSVISSNKAFNLDVGEMTYFSTAIAVIQPDSTKRVSLRTAISKATPDTLFCNITVCRQLSPLGLWRISDINFFDQSFVP
uniref:Mitochondrial import inner membrane translocase subunit TIM44 n=1 Tax=Panagrellus redivivus TaxID=6233 RepID=A0A7E4ZZ62_PANRE